MTAILYLVHDLTDAAVRRRLIMMRAGGAAVTVAGFRRGPTPISAIEGEPVIELGQTADGNFPQRIARVLTTITSGLERRLGGARPDVIVARNLEMLAIAYRYAAMLPGNGPRVVYETLDIHRLLLRQDTVGSMLRRLERSLIERTSLVLTSSPAFRDDYLVPVQNVTKPIVLVENKVIELDPPFEAARPERPAQGPIRIGWFGALRCRKSLRLLAAFSRRMEGAYEIVLRGRPAYREIPDFDAFVAAEPFMRFEGAYRSPEDLAAIYWQVDYVWAIDFFEEGLNSRWLLPNRLYEGCRHGGVPIAMDGTQTARFLAEHGIGLVLPDASPEGVAELLAAADRDALRERVNAMPRYMLIADRDDCRALVALMAPDRGAPVQPELEEAA